MKAMKALKAKAWKKHKLRFRLIVGEEYQPIQAIPKRMSILIWIVILVTFSLQVNNNLSLPPPKVYEIDLPEAPGEVMLTALSLGDKVTFSKVLTLWLQAFDNQQGQSLSFHDLDYDKVVRWMQSILYLDPRTEYPLLNATHVYSFIKDKEKVRTMIDFVRGAFAEDPARRWQWMAGATTLAKNEVEDIDLALEMAQELREGIEGIEGVPSWARQMEGFLLQDLNRFEEAIVFLENLVESGELTDENELNLHIDRLFDLLTEMREKGEFRSREQQEEMFNRLDAAIQRFVELKELKA